MKKMLMIVSVLSLMLSMCPVTALAAGESATVYVTIADDNGAAVMAAEAVTVTDHDGDGALTVHDALYAAHEQAFDGGAAAGYATAQTEYGASLSRLWGIENGSGYGYYVNNASAWSLVDPVADGDYVNAFVYTDTEAFSDAYCWFDQATVSGKEGDSVTLTLTAAGYDANWNSITLPVADAVITFDGEKTAYKTDKDGKVTLTLDGGDYIISAVSDSKVLVPPVCKASVEATTTTTAQTTSAPTTTTVAVTTTATSASPNTGDGSFAAWALLAAALAAVLVFAAARVKVYEA